MKNKKKSFGIELQTHFPETRKDNDEIIRETC